MADLEPHRITIRTPDGEWDKVTAYSLQSEWLQPTDTWSVTVVDLDKPRQLRERFRPWVPVEILLDGQTQIVGRIESISGDGASTLTLEGNDYLADAVGGGVDPTLRVTKNQNLGDVILAALRPFGIERTFGDFNRARNILTGRNPFVGGPALDFRNAQLSDFKPNHGEGAFAFANRVAARHGFTIQQSFDRRTIAIVQPEYRQSPIGKLHKPGNVLSCRCRRNWGNVPTVTIATGRTGSPSRSLAGMKDQIPTFGPDAPSPIGKLPEVQRIVKAEDGSPRVITERRKGLPSPDPNHPVYRPVYYEDKDSRTPEQLQRGIRRMLAEKLKDTLTYTATLRGHKDPSTGAIYAVDTVDSVIDEIEAVEEDMWVMGRTFSNNGTSGPITQLQLIRLGGLTL